MLAKILESKVFLSGENLPEYFLHRVNLCYTTIRFKIYFILINLLQRNLLMA